MMAVSSTAASDLPNARFVSMDQCRGVAILLMFAGFGLIAYAVLVLICDLCSVQLGLLRTLGQNPLLAYLLDMTAGSAVSALLPEGGGWPWALAESGLRFALAYLPVRLLEWRRIHLRL
jgi:hypothetical protein